jgi:hypothetical protein
MDASDDATEASCSRAPAPVARSDKRVVFLDSCRPRQKGADKANDTVIALCVVFTSVLHVSSIAFPPSLLSTRYLLLSSRDRYIEVVLHLEGLHVVRPQDVPGV